MKKAELITAFSIEVIGIWVMVDSYRLGLQTLSNPGPGFYPFVLAVLLCLLGLPLCKNAFRQVEKRGAPGQSDLDVSLRLKKSAIVIGCLLGYSLFLELLGFPLITFLFLFVLFLIGYPRRWFFISVSSIVLVVFSYFVFAVLLQVPLPLGILSR